LIEETGNENPLEFVFGEVDAEMFEHKLED
jgi:hypothetical protein